MSDQLPADVRHVLLCVSRAMLCGLTVAILAGPDIAKWWRNSVTVRCLRCLRWRVADVGAAMAYPFLLLRKRRPAKPAAGVEASPTPAPAVPHLVEVSRGADQ